MAQGGPPDLEEELVSAARIFTNGHLRPLAAWADLPVDVRAEFTYLDDHEILVERFVWVYGSWYDVMDTQIINVAPEFESFGYNVAKDSPLAAWSCITTDSAWTGVVFRWPSDEQVHRWDLYSDRWGWIIVGRYTS